MAFDLGMIVQTAAVACAVEDDPNVRVQVTVALDRFASGDWGDISPEDGGMNDLALEGGGRLMGAYPTDAGRIWIITEADRSATMMLFPDEY